MSDWKALALKCASKVGLQGDIMLATVEAETNGKNELGDKGRAFGYGQVWLKWHYSKLVKAASMIGINNLPAEPKTEAEEQKFKPIILGNNELSMMLAAVTIKAFWDSASHDWDKFTRGYVGPNIPGSDLERRRKIWVKYHDKVADIPSVVGDITQPELAKYAGIGLAVVGIVALLK